MNIYLFVVYNMLHLNRNRIPPVPTVNSSQPPSPPKTTTCNHLASCNHWFLKTFTRLATSKITQPKHSSTRNHLRK